MNSTCFILNQVKSNKFLAFVLLLSIFIHINIPYINAFAIIIQYMNATFRCTDRILDTKDTIRIFDYVFREKDVALIYCSFVTALNTNIFS